MAVASATDFSTNRIPISLKIAYTAFMCVLIPYYLHAYGPGNLLWFCDVALIVTLAALWTESRYLFSMQAVAIVFPQFMWIVDFFWNMIFGGPLVGLATYMFNPEIPLFVRGLSLFHGWMPILLLWLVWKTGYDRTAWKAQVGLCWTVLVAVFVLMPSPDTPAGNVNKVFGWGDTAQTVMHPLAWLGLLMLAYPLLVYVPSHLFFRRFAPAPDVR